MATATITGTPELDYTYTDSHPSLTLRYAGTGKEQRIELQALTRRSWTWPMHRDAAERKNIDDFFRARSGSVVSFYLEDPKDSALTGVSLGTSVSGQTTFALPTSGENSRYYFGGSVTVYDDGSAVGCTVTPHVDARTVGLSVAPASGSVMTCAFTGVRLVKLKSPITWTEITPDWFGCVAEFQEVAE